MTIFFGSRRARWAVPVAVLATAGAIAGGVALAGESSSELADKDVAELLADVQNADLAPFSGTVVQTSRLGLPSLPGLADSGEATSLMNMLTGSNTARIWFTSAEQFRFSLMGAADEFTLIRDHDDIWLWSSEANSAEHLVLPSGLLSQMMGDGASPDPQFAAQDLLDKIEPSTEVVVSGAAEVAGRSAYELAIRPRDEGSLIDEIAIAIDGETSRVLRLEVVAEDMTEPAFEIGFTSVSFEEPSDEVYRFNPPPGVEVNDHNVLELFGMLMNGGDGSPLGDAFGGDGVGGEGSPLGDAFGGDGVGGEGFDGAGSPLDDLFGGSGVPGGDQLTVIGDGWTSVLVLRAPDDAAGKLGALALAGREVSGSYGSGRLFTTSLLSVLWLDDGQVLVGAVTPELLETSAEGLDR